MVIKTAMDSSVIRLCHPPDQQTQICQSKVSHLFLKSILRLIFRPSERFWRIGKLVGGSPGGLFQEFLQGQEFVADGLQ
jgi:hypothetical protein